jgi:uncharacterized membrane protein
MDHILDFWRFYSAIILCLISAILFFRKIFGIFVILIGIGIGYYAFIMDTTVKVNYSKGNNMGLPERVNNLGLMSDKQTYLIISAFLIIGGSMLVAIAANSTNSTKKTEKDRNYEKNSSIETTSAPSYCSNCGKPYSPTESIKFCSECGNKL